MAELGAEVLYRVCDAQTFVGSCVDPQASLRSLCRTVLVNTLTSLEVREGEGWVGGLVVFTLGSVSELMSTCIVVATIAFHCEIFHVILRKI